MILTKTYVAPASVIGQYQVCRIGINPNQKLRLIEIRVAGNAVQVNYASVSWDNDEIGQLPVMVYNPDYVFETVIDGPGTLAVDMIVTAPGANPITCIVMYEIL